MQFHIYDAEAIVFILKCGSFGLGYNFKNGIVVMVPVKAIMRRVVL